MNEKMQMIDRVISGGYCVGCGLCRHVAPNDFIIEPDTIGRLQAKRVEEARDSVADRVCPFSDTGPHESELSAQLFAGASQHSPDFGAYESLYAGYVVEGTFRANGSSGGMGTWIANELLRLGLVDVVVSVGPEDGSYAFRYSTSATSEQLSSNSKSRYYQVAIGRELDAAFRFDRIAVVGLPCFIKGIRRLAEVDQKARTKLRYTISLVCGHLKSRSFGQLLAWQLGVSPTDLASVNYRLKIPGRSASRYGVAVWSRDGRQVQAPMEGLVGHNWGHGLLKLEACDYCDDVFGETADVSIGDAWLPKYEADHKGTNVVVVRTPELARIIAQARDDGRLNLEALSPEEVALSQAAGLRHRREGLRYRLALKERAGLWFPRKRVAPSVDHLPMRARNVQDVRMRVRDLSHTLFADALSRNDLNVFTDGIRPVLSELDGLQQATAKDRLASTKRRAVNMGKKLIRLFVG